MGVSKYIGFYAYLYIQRTLQVLLPYLAAKASSTGSALIRTLANELKANRREILINNFKYIFSHLVCSCTKEELERAFHYLQVFYYHTYTIIYNCLHIQDTTEQFVWHCGHVVVVVNEIKRQISSLKVNVTQINLITCMI